MKGLPWKQAIVVGASSGIGEALSRRLAAQGCAVAMVARRQEELDRIAEEIGRSGSRAPVVATAHDVRQRDEVPGLFQDLCHRLGGLDVIFYVAGVMPRVAPDEYDTGKDALIMEINTLGAMAWLNEAAKRFERLRTGTIVGVSSIAGDRGRRGNPAYCTSKAALNTFLESLRNRLSRFGVSVVTVKPGFVDTVMLNGAPKVMWVISPDTAAERMIDAAVAGRNTVYVPSRWRGVGGVLRMIPSFVFRRLDL